MDDLRAFRESSDELCSNVPDPINLNRNILLDPAYTYDYDDDEIELINQTSTNQTNRLSADELPIFAIKSLSPTGRTISPIDSDTNSSNDSTDDESGDSQELDDDMVSITEINEKIGVTSPYDLTTNQTPIRKRLNLETIHEGVFLDTPPIPPPKRHCAIFSPSNQSMELCKELINIAIERMSIEENKENDDKSDFEVDESTGSISNNLPDSPISTKSWNKRNDYRL